MRIAIIGAGFAGLSTAWHLLSSSQSSAEVVVFDTKGVGGGASGIAAGLLHPYVGEEGKRSLFASEALEESNTLISLVQSTQEKPFTAPGIIRKAYSEKQRDLFFSHKKTYGDIEPLDNELFPSFFIRSGQTVDCPAYLEGLWQLIAAKGGVLVKQKIEDLFDLHEFDQIIVASGGGTPHITGLNPLAASVLKGQVLLCQAPDSVSLPPYSLISKGYLAFLKNSKTLYVGSTYERGVIDEIPDLFIAGQILFPKVGAFFPSVRELIVLECKAALRVVRKGHYFPILEQQGERVWLFTALGSRGLLYHALLGKVLSRAVLTRDASLLEPYSRAF